jgi:hypothetical protein
MSAAHRQDNATNVTAKTMAEESALVKQWCSAH